MARSEKGRYLTYRGISLTRAPHLGPSMLDRGVQTLLALSLDRSRKNIGQLLILLPGEKRGLVRMLVTLGRLTFRK